MMPRQIRRAEWSRFLWVAMLAMAAAIAASAGRANLAAAAQPLDKAATSLGWVPAGTASRLKVAGAKELHAAELPLVMPGGAVVPIKDAQKRVMTSNELLPEVVASVSGQLVERLAQVEAAAKAGTPIALVPPSGSQNRPRFTGQPGSSEA